MQHRMKTHPLTKEKIDNLLISTSIGSLATLNNDGSPYVIPVHFLYHNEALYIHGLPKGQKIDNMRADSRVCMTVYEMESLLLDPNEEPCETNTKYERLLYKISYNILSNHEDSQECVNDAYIKAWNSIPPERPRSFTAYLGRIVRNLSIDYWNKNRAQKRYSGGDILLSELQDCIPSSNTVWA